jgi:hypothetical protein
MERGRIEAITERLARLDAVEGENRNLEQARDLK